ncbi:hypothetical protein EWB00_000207 [Schistosoma japonicum]|uniref:Uncharacterized protein n=1 Tax=Schistosoma japonicum TaxID=6182 RepID=A0A4Z2DJQ9_SCHJA|nr:hypothetical protein EWB00_000207 [Schistosoma japonicum]
MTQPNDVTFPEASNKAILGKQNTQDLLKNLISLDVPGLTPTLHDYSNTRFGDCTHSSNSKTSQLVENVR